MFEGNDAAGGNAMLIEALTELVTLEHAESGDDITARLVQHPAELDDREIIEQLVPLYGAGVEPVLNLIANTLLLILTNDRVGGSLLASSLSTRDALDKVLFEDPPMANFCMTYPRQPGGHQHRRLQQRSDHQRWRPDRQPIPPGLGCRAARLSRRSVRVSDRPGWCGSAPRCPARYPPRCRELISDSTSPAADTGTKGEHRQLG
ncbi:cytochrome P450 [Nocardia albiluteola]|uniref:cytochrome P450 n=1 Tax=Nocardia albiluteola TaxID=2842303 RepID=UPI001C0657E0